MQSDSPTMTSPDRTIRCLDQEIYDPRTAISKLISIAEGKYQLNSADYPKPIDFNGIPMTKEYVKLLQKTRTAALKPMVDKMDKWWDKRQAPSEQLGATIRTYGCSIAVECTN